MPQQHSILLYKTLSGRPVVESFIESLDIDSQVRVRNAIRLLTDYGLELMKVNLVKKIHRKPDLFELRIQYTTNIRLLFSRHDTHTLIIVHGFTKKTQKLPINELRLAVKRAKEFE